jgi:hypothetical protein
VCIYILFRPTFATQYCIAKIKWKRALHFDIVPLCEMRPFEIEHKAARKRSIHHLPTTPSPIGLPHGPMGNYLFMESHGPGLDRLSIYGEGVCERVF